MIQIFLFLKKDETIFKKIMLRRKNKYKTMNFCIQELRSHTIFTYILLILVMTPVSLCIMPCTNNFWWDPVKTICIDCTICNEDMIVLRPCISHRDTICGTINDLEFDWSWLARTESRDLLWKERRKNAKIAKTVEFQEEWDWQAASLGLAAVVCLLFFIGAAFISFHHARQLRNIERRFDRDVEQLSARLMAKFKEVNHLENSTIFLEDSNKGLHDSPIEVQCIYLDQLLAGKDNIYIEEGKINY